MSIEVSFGLSQPGGFELDVRFDAPGRGVTALFGRSGSGKTTVLRCIAGLQKAYGSFQINGDLWQDSPFWLPTHQRPIGYVFQEASLFPHMSVMKNLTYSMRASGTTKSEIPFDDVVELLGISEMLKRRPSGLSGGERQRVAIARALLSNPRLLLMDEPLSALDHGAKQAILPYLERLHNELDIPAIYVSHDPNEVAQLAERMVFLENGTVKASGPVNKMMTSLDLPISGYDNVSALLEGKVSAHDDTFHLTYLNCSGNRITIPREDMPIGEHARIQVHAKDVSLALSTHHDTSISNILPALIIDLKDADKAQMLVRLQLEDGQTLLARITKKSALSMSLREQMLVYAQIKGVALI